MKIGQNWKLDKIGNWTKLKIGQNWKLNKIEKVDKGWRKKNYICRSTIDDARTQKLWIWKSRICHRWGVAENYASNEWPYIYLESWPSNKQISFCILVGRGYLRNQYPCHWQTRRPRRPSKRHRGLQKRLLTSLETSSRQWRIPNQPLWSGKNGHVHGFLVACQKRQQVIFNFDSFHDRFVH